MNSRQALPCLAVVMLMICFFCAGARVARQSFGADQTSLSDLEWLETPRDQKAINWAKQQTQESIRRLETLPSYQQVSNGLDRLLKGVPTQPHIVLMGNRAVRLLVTQANPYGELQLARRDAAGVPGPWRTVLDIAALRKKTGIPYELSLIEYLLRGNCLPPEYNRCLLPLSFAGSDEAEIREFDLDKGEFVKDGFYVPKSLSETQWLNRDLVIVGQTATSNAPRTPANRPLAIQLWRRGEPLQAAQVVYQAEPGDALVLLTSAGSGSSRYALITRLIDFSHFEIRIVHQDGRVEQAPFPQDALRAMDLMTRIAGPKSIFVELTRDIEIAGKTYSAKTLLSYAVDPSVPATKRTSAVYRPCPDDFLDPVFTTATGNGVAFVPIRRLVPRVMVATLANGNWSVHQVVQADPGQAIGGVAGDEQDDDVLVTVRGFVTPSRQVLYRPPAASHLLAEDPVLFDGSNYTTEIRSAKSKDGTDIDYYLLKPRVPQHKGPQPLLVTGYAAFGISFTPSYFGYEVAGPAFKLWLDRGGSLVIPAARGGGEHGEPWHRAAMRELRQNSYDDFIAVVQQLIDSGFTAPSRIGAFGMSNGGLLAAVLGTERPDLFGAIVSDVPLADMFRMKYMGAGPLWLEEYGDPADPRMAQVLQRYSPLQNVRAGVKYPPFFISVSTADDRVGPGHARKMAARLESVGAQVYFYEDTEGGHGVSDAYRNPQLMALRMAFLIDNLMKGQH